MTLAPPRPRAAGDDLTRPHRLPFLPGVDGLRAIAVLAVLLFHSEFSWIPGGFLGVDAFFVISGYLITALLWTEYQDSGRVDYRRFLIRRARRLLPALGLFLAGSFAMAAVFARDALAKLFAELPAAIFYVYNWFAIGSEQSYFESFERPSFFQHLWSLAIEEQFYLVWPVVLLIGLRFLSRRRMLLVVLGGVAASTILMAALYVPLVDPSRLYYGTDTRFAGLLVGAALAFAWHPARARIGMERFGITARATDIAGILGLAVLGWAFLELRGDVVGSARLYRGGFLIASVGTALAVAATAHPGTRLGAMLGHPVLRYLGRRSYAIYLWHWPVFMITRPRVDVGIHGIGLFTFRLVVTLVLAELSYRLVERPIRRGTLVAGIRRWAAAPFRLPWPTRAATAFGSVALVATSLFVVQGNWDATVASAVAAPPDPTVTQPTTTAPPVTTSTVATETPASPTRRPTDAEPVTVPPDTGPAISAAGAGPVPEEPGSDDDAGPAASEPDKAPEPRKDDQKETAATGGVGAAASQGQEAAATQNAEGSANDLSRDLDEFEKGTTTTAPPEPAGPAPFVAIGDSVMLGAAEALQGIGAETVNAEVSRAWQAAPALAASMQDQGVIGDVLVVHLGTNGPLTAELFDELMGTLDAVERVIVVNVRVPRRWEGEVNTVIAEGVGRWPNAEVVDWYGHANDKPELFVADGVHLTAAGKEAYASLVSAAING